MAWEVLEQYHHPAKIIDYGIGYGLGGSQAVKSRLIFVHNADAKQVV